MKSRFLRISAIACVFGLAALAAGCSKPVAVLEPPHIDPVVDVAGASLNASEGVATAVGFWSVTVQESEIAAIDPNVPVEAGKKRLKVKVNLKNTGTTAQSVKPADFVAVDAAGTVLDVVPSVVPVEQGEATVDAGAAADVNVSFAVPDKGGPFKVRFRAKKNVDGAAETADTVEVELTHVKGLDDGTGDDNGTGADKRKGAKKGEDGVHKSGENENENENEAAHPEGAVSGKNKVKAGSGKKK